MDDLQKVVGLVEKKQREGAKKQQEWNELARQNEERLNQSFSDLQVRVTAFKNALKGKVKVYVSPSEGGDLIVSISSSPPFVRRPFYKFVISPSLFDSEYGCRIKAHDKEEVYQSSLTLEGVIGILSDSASDFLLRRSAREYGLPYWYTIAGGIISWPLFVLVWLGLAFGGGILGLFFGWIPALIVKYCAKYLWLPAVIYILFLVSQQ